MSCWLCSSVVVVMALPGDRSHMALNTKLCGLLKCLFIGTRVRVKIMTDECYFVCRPNDSLHRMFVGQLTYSPPYFAV